MAPPPSRFGPKRSRQPPPRRGVQRGRREGAAVSPTRRRRIVRARRPVGAAAEPMPSPPSDGAVDSEAAYQEAVAAAAAVVYDARADPPMAGWGWGPGSSNDGSEDSSFVPTDDDSCSSSSEQSDGCGSSTNRFGVLVADDSGESGSESEDGSFDSNPFNALIDDESSSEDDGSDDLSLGGVKVACSKARECKLLVDDDSIDDGAAKCAVCFLHDDQCHTWRRLLTLPCCGLEGKEESSSTRFCAACILRMATTRSDPSVSNEYHPSDPERFQPTVDRFYRNDVQTDTRRVIECPRCRDLLVVKIKKTRAGRDDDDESSGCDCGECLESKGDWSHPKDAQSISVRTPSFEERCRYAGKKVGNGEPIAGMLWRAAFLHHNFMPEICLGIGCDQLLRWGIIEKASAPIPQQGAKDLRVFKMPPGHQRTLVEFFDLESHQDEIDPQDIDADLFVGMTCAIVSFATTFHFVKAVRLVNRFLMLFLYFRGFIPLFPLKMWQQWVVTALNVFVAGTVVQFLFVAIVYTACFLGVGLTVCYFLRQSNKLKAIWWQMILVTYFAWRAWMFAYHSPSITWLGLVAPKAAVAIKKIIWV